MRRIALAIVLGIALAGTATVALGSRNTSGTYSLPTGNPVITGTPITKDWANNTLGDLATEMSSSLDRSGRGGMLAPLRTPDGTVTAPAHSFTNETGTGFYRIGASDVGLSVVGVKQCEWNSTGAIIPGNITTEGTITLDSGSGQGLYKAGGGPFGIGSLVGQVDFYAGGVLRASLLAGGNFSMGNFAVQNVGTPVNVGDAATKGYVDAKFVVSGRITGGSSTIATQVGSVTATVARTGVGIYTLTVPGLTAGGVVSVGAIGASDGSAAVVSVGSGSCVVWGIKTGASSDAVDVTFTVSKL